MNILSKIIKFSLRYDVIFLFANGLFLCLSLLAMDCVMSEWSEWSECSKSCGKGHLIRSRMITLEPQFGGDLCPETTQRKTCKIKKCNQGGLNSDERKRRKEDRKKRRNKQGREESADELAGEHASVTVKGIIHPKIFILSSCTYSCHPRCMWLSFFCAYGT